MLVSGVAHELAQQDPIPDIEAAPMVVIPNDDNNGEDVTGPTVEAHVELAKTIGK